MDIEVSSAIVFERVSVDFPLLGISIRDDDRSTINAEAGTNSVGATVFSKHGRLTLRALDEVSVDVKFGERVGVFGANGSGKSTFLRVAAGVISPTAGRVVRGSVATAILDVTAGMEPEATGYENVKVLCLAYGHSLAFAKEISPTVKAFSELGPFMSLPMSCYSSGMVVRLAVSTLLHLPTNILLLDEWLSVADQKFNAKVQRALMQKISNASCLVLASQSRELLEGVCTKIITLSRGQLVKIENLVEGRFVANAG